MAAEQPIFLRNRHEDNAAIPSLNGKFGDFSRGPAWCPAPTRSSGFSPNYPAATREFPVTSRWCCVPAPTLLPSFCPPANHAAARAAGGTAAAAARCAALSSPQFQLYNSPKITQDGQQLLPQHLLSENFRFPRCRFTGLLLISVHQLFRI